MIDYQLIKLLRQNFQLDWHGIHGVSHWARVRINGLLLAKQNGADQRVVELFAFLHDSMRYADYDDRLHGLRAAEFVRDISLLTLGINSSKREILAYACEHHSSGITEADITVATCWDSDRLDLGRAGATPRIEKLCTEAARQPEFIARAYQRSRYLILKNTRDTTLIQKWRP